MEEKNQAVFTQKEDSPLQLYLHIPFCVKKCRYCDFLSAPSTEEEREAYVDRLQKEIQRKAAAPPFNTEKTEKCGKKQVSTIFIGGGTPSLLTPQQTEQILETVYENFSLEKDVEITIECNPGTLDPERIRTYRSLGINRISMGLQSAKKEELQLLGRIHTYEDFLKSYDGVRRGGFENVNVDLIFGLPGQSLEDWAYTLNKVLPLSPSHVSAYGLIVEENTPFFQQYREDVSRREKGEETRELPNEELECRMYQYTVQRLAQYGYEAYEISNFAKKGKICRHNDGYWTRKNYMGLGLGAASLWNNVRFTNTRNWKEYMAENFFPREEIVLSRREQMEETFFLGLRRRKGVSRQSFRETFGVEPEAVYGNEISRLCREGLLRQEGGIFFLSEEGCLLCIYVMAQLLKE